MGLGMILILLSLIASFAMDTSAHMSNNNYNTTICMFSEDSIIMFYLILKIHFHKALLFLIIQLVLSALSHMLIYIAVFEFICSQSPHSMKGLLIGLLYAIKGLYQVLRHSSCGTLCCGLHLSFPSTGKQLSCGFYYYLANIVIGLIAVLVYMWVAKKYRYRERDEPCNVRRYAEEYYSNPQREQNYDYSEILP